MRTARTTQIAARAVESIAKWGPGVVLVDDTGHYGHGVIDALVEGNHPAIGIVFSGKPLDKRYRNRRTEMWLEMAKWVRAGGALPNRPELVRELTEPTYTFVDGTFWLEEKDSIKKRLGVSPDIADALALTFSIPDMPDNVEQRLIAELVANGGYPAPGSGKAAITYDPMQQTAPLALDAGVGHALVDYDPMGNL
jgi:hypothetical protein